jgi:hypothetical protein
MLYFKYRQHHVATSIDVATFIHARLSSTSCDIQAVNQMAD